MHNTNCLDSDTESRWWIVTHMLESIEARVDIQIATKHAFHVEILGVHGTGKGLLEAVERALASIFCPSVEA